MMYRKHQWWLCRFDFFFIIFGVFVISRIQHVNSNNNAERLYPDYRTPRSLASSSHSQPLEVSTITTTVTWEEIRNDDRIEEPTATNKRRPSFWDPPFPWNRDQNSSWDSNTDLKPHPLRTHLWDLKLHWRKSDKGFAQTHHPSHAQRLNSHNRLIMELDTSGYVRIRPHAQPSLNDSNGRWFPMIGTWQLDPGSLVVWSIPDESNSNDYWYEFRAHFHVNPFGKHPKMIRGTVVRHNCDLNGQRKKQWFPPIVGSFTAIGCGPDTADLSYRKRKPPRQV